MSLCVHAAWLRIAEGFSGGGGGGEDEREKQRSSGQRAARDGAVATAIKACLAC